MCICIKQNSGHKFVWFLKLTLSKRKLWMFKFYFQLFIYEILNLAGIRKGFDWKIVGSAQQFYTRHEQWKKFHLCRLDPTRCKMQNSALQGKLSDWRRVYLEATWKSVDWKIDIENLNWLFELPGQRYSTLFYPKPQHICAQLLWVITCTEWHGKPFILLDTTKVM